MDINDNNKIDKLLLLSNRARESRDYVKAIELATLVVSSAKTVNYTHGIVHGYLQIAKVHKLKYQERKLLDDLNNMELAVKKANTAVTGTKDLIDLLLVWENYAEHESLKGDWKKCLFYWQKINNKWRQQDAFKGRTLGHLAEAQYENGFTDEAVKNAEKSIEIMENNDERQLGSDLSYRWLVWYTGNLMKLFEIYYRINNVRVNKIKMKLEDFLKEPRLKIRRHQWEEVKGKLGIIK